MQKEMSAKTWLESNVLWNRMYSGGKERDY